MAFTDLSFTDKALAILLNTAKPLPIANLKGLLDIEPDSEDALALERDLEKFRLKIPETGDEIYGIAVPIAEKVNARFPTNPETSAATIS